MGPKLKATIAMAAMFAIGVGSGLAWKQYCDDRPGRRMGYVSRRLERMKTTLNLTPEQEKSVREIFERAHERARQVNEEVAWDLADIHRDSIKSIQSVLTPEQQKAFEQMHKRSHRHRRWKDHSWKGESNDTLPKEGNHARP